MRNPRLILTADGDALFLELSHALLTGQGYEVVKALDDPVAAVQRERPDLLLLDVAMPGPDGL